MESGEYHTCTCLVGIGPRPRADLLGLQPKTEHIGTQPPFHGSRDGTLHGSDVHGVPSIHGVGSSHDLCTVEHTTSANAINQVAHYWYVALYLPREGCLARSLLPLFTFPTESAPVPIQTRAGVCVRSIFPSEPSGKTEAAMASSFRRAHTS